MHNEPFSAADEAVLLWRLTRSYGSGDSRVTALDEVTAGFPVGSFTAVMGPSGSGKSTLLQCAAGLDRPTSGRVVVAGTELGGMSEKRLTLLRRDRIGFVFQAFNLVSALSAEQNVGLPLRLAGARPKRAEIRSVLAEVGLAGRERHRPGALSGGQQQRVAIARALATRPEVLFADEPTGALDSESSRLVLGLLRGFAGAADTPRGGPDPRPRTVIMVTHDPFAASYADRVLFLADGRVVDTLERPSTEAVAARLAALESTPASERHDSAGTPR
ncbi:putative ABC transport system ATP-binding protein [Murinocardiopsis flavida]|uniref:Putative ABC transport system ATP-binding protein n=1 Tax=Murinocardiopsis flavida TaxID=645275 RepID=A0A2P8CW09_9ACTN|nr:ABC transporter ATP-binding protein [Murinocardiopsis flavida]PSK89136.1 putative ABC transport system ATP-binding protein [Murinocardiopsis flavida]